MLVEAHLNTAPALEFSVYKLGHLGLMIILFQQVFQSLFDIILGSLFLIFDLFVFYV